MSLDALSQFGEPGFSPLVDAGQEILLPELQRRLATYGLGNSDLAQSVQIEVEGDELRILMAPYGKYVNFGVKGTQGGFADPDDGYIHSFGTKRPPTGVFARYSADPSIQFAIATKIFKFGIRPRPFLPTPDDAIWEKINLYLADKLGDGIEQQLRKVTISTL